MRFLKFALFVCVVVEEAKSTVATNNSTECTGPPPQYNNSTFDHCTEQTTGGCNCTVANQTCLHGDRLFYTCDHGTDLDFIIVCDYMYADDQGHYYGWVVDNVTQKFEDCTGSPAPMQATPEPQPTAPPIQACIRLVESEKTPHETTGILQVQYNDTWGSVCHTGTWTNHHLANITCRLLEFNSYGSFWEMALPINNRPPTISLDAWEVNIAYCSGQELSLWDCTLAPDKSTWLTYAVFGSTACPSILTISCQVSSTLPNLTYCPPTTTTPNPTVSTDHTEEPDTESAMASGNEPPPNTGLSGVVCLVACSGSKRNTRRVAKQPPRQREAAELTGSQQREQRQAAGVRAGHRMELSPRDTNFTDQEPRHEIETLTAHSDDRNLNQLTHDPVSTTARQTETQTSTAKQPGPFERESSGTRAGPTEGPSESEHSPPIDERPVAQPETPNDTYIHESEDTREGDIGQFVEKPRGTDFDQQDEATENCETEAPNTTTSSTEASADRDSVIEEHPEETTSPTGRCSILSTDTHRAAWTESTDGPTERDNTDQPSRRVSQSGRPTGRLSSVTNPIFPSPDEWGPLGSPFHQDTEGQADNQPVSAGQDTRVQDDVTEEDL
ncbi:hypothetical protein Bbelb_358460 [Branchiostoma belcheri]|nr:hypothetical protein Bbelb_358460 [Branchiostoma belcheri]